MKKSVKVAFSVTIAFDGEVTLRTAQKIVDDTKEAVYRETQPRSEVDEIHFTRMRFS